MSIFTRRRFLTTVAGAATALALMPGSANAFEPLFKTVAPLDLALDRGGVYTLHFAYMPPRITKVKISPTEEKTVWYMVYYVYNRTGKPQTVYPVFELVTKDQDGVRANFLDEPQPVVLDAIRKIEDPTGELKLHSSISMSKVPIPESSPDAVPRAVYGVAIWLDVPALAPNVNNFSVYVSGISDGLSFKETSDDKIMVSKKTLQIDFRRPTDAFRDKPNDIKINDNNGLGAEQWQYRETSVKDKK